MNVRIKLEELLEETIKRHRGTARAGDGTPRGERKWKKEKRER